MKGEKLTSTRIKQFCFSFISVVFHMCEPLLMSSDVCVYILHINLLYPVLLKVIYVYTYIRYSLLTECAREMNPTKHIENKAEEWTHAVQWTCHSEDTDHYHSEPYRRLYGLFE